MVDSRDRSPAARARVYPAVLCQHHKLGVVRYFLDLSADLTAVNRLASSAVLAT